MKPKPRFNQGDKVTVSNPLLKQTGIYDFEIMGVVNENYLVKMIDNEIGNVFPQPISFIDSNFEVRS